MDQPMSYTIRIIEKAVVEIVHVGDFGSDEARRARDEAAELMFAEKLNRILADISKAKVRDSTLGLFRFNATHYDVLPRNTRIATLLVLDTLDPSLAEFSETVALNRGIQLRLFQDRETALKWLLKRKH
jgi:hypothetical protein